jgi:8-oxo-dGTP pyrophosphatase MutT (NUDIX family)
VDWHEATERLSAALAGPLPGHDAFLNLSGYKRPDLEAAQRSDPPPRQSAVLALIYPRNGEAHTVLMLRATYDGVHSGQVSFPGGRMEPSDADLRQTALREFAEETGERPDARVLGALTPVYIPPSRSLVTPFAAAAEAVGPFAPDAREVAELIEAPLSLLLRDDILKQREQRIAMMGRSMRVPYFDVRGRVVWGATAMMIAELRELLRR